MGDSKTLATPAYQHPQLIETNPQHSDHERPSGPQGVLHMVQPIWVAIPEADANPKHT
jgi:hypothetical protein